MKCPQPCFPCPSRLTFNLLCLGLLLIPSVSLRAQAEDAPAPGVGSPVMLPGNPPIQFTLTGLSYALGWPATSPSMVPNAREKLLVISYKLSNEGDRDLDVKGDPVDLTVVDSLGRGASVEGPVRILQTVEEADFLLLPGMEAELYTAAIVPARAKVASLRVERRKGNEPGTMIDVKDSVAPLPPSLRDAYDRSGSGMASEIVATQDKWYGHGLFDVNVESMRIHQDPAAGVDPGEEDAFFEMLLSVRNRSAHDHRLSRNSFAPSRLYDSSGAPFEPSLLLYANDDRKVNVDISPGRELQVRMLYRVPADVQLNEVAIAEAVQALSDPRAYVYRATGTLSSPFPSSGGTGAEGVDLSSIGSRNRTDARTSGYGGQAVGVYDPFSAQPFQIRQVPESTLPDGSIKPVVADQRRTQDASPPAPEPDGEQETDATEETAAGEESAPMDPADYLIKVESLKIEKTDEAGGDEPAFLLVQFRGIVGEPSPPPTIYRPDTDLFVPADNANMPSGTVTLFDEAIAVETFADVRPFEVFGTFLLGMEIDGNTDAAAIASNAYGRVRSNWQRFIDAEWQTDLSASTPEAARREVRKILQRYYETFLDDLNLYQDAFVDDDVVGPHFFFWIHVPVLSDSEIVAMADDLVPEFLSREWRTEIWKRPTPPGSYTATGGRRTASVGVFGGQAARELYHWSVLVAED